MDDSFNEYIESTLFMSAQTLAYNYTQPSRVAGGRFVPTEYTAEVTFTVTHIHLCSVTYFVIRIAPEQ